MAFKRDKLVEVKAPFIRPACSLENCQDDAICRVHVPTGWANFCRFHYDLHWTREARAYTANLGAKSANDCRAYVLAHRKDAADRGSKGWARDILSRHQRGERLASGHPITALHVRLATDATRGFFGSDRTPGSDDE